MKLWTSDVETASATMRRGVSTAEAHWALLEPSWGSEVAE